MKLIWSKETSDFFTKNKTYVWEKDPEALYHPDEYFTIDDNGGQHYASKYWLSENFIPAVVFGRPVGGI